MDRKQKKAAEGSCGERNDLQHHDTAGNSCAGIHGGKAFGQRLTVQGQHPSGGVARQQPELQSHSH